MGEPMQNLDAVLGVMQKLNSSIKSPGHIDWLPCFNTIVPSKVNTLYGLEALAKVLDVKDDLGGMMHVQISVNSTDEATRKNLFNGANVVPLKSIIEFINTRKITNRTVTLNFISMKGVEVDLKKLQQYGLDPKKFAVKIIPLNATINATKNVLETEYNYKNVEQLKSLEHQFREAGIPVVTDAVAKCEEAALCCGQLVREYWPCSQ
jgi:adenine C2-methylase RlmN of 23S rRNA A2503 and tRNA A37